MGTYNIQVNTNHVMNNSNGLSLKKSKKLLNLSHTLFIKLYNNANIRLNINRTHINNAEPAGQY
jgi:hypothetical protein